MKSRLLFAACLSLLSSSLVHASADNSVLIGGKAIDYQYIAGSGANTSYLVVDFANAGGTGPGNTYLYEYQWDTPVTATEMLTNISNSVVPDPLHVGIDTTYGAAFIDDFSYLTETSPGRASAFWRIAAGEPTPDLSDSSILDMAWTELPTGTDLETIKPGEFIGASFVDYVYDSASDTLTYTDRVIDPRVPTVSALPEPSSMALLGGASLWLLNRRKSRRPASR